MDSTTTKPINDSQVRWFSNDKVLFEHFIAPPYNQGSGVMKQSPQFGDGYFSGKQIPSYFSIMHLSLHKDLTHYAEVKIFENSNNIHSSEWQNEWFQILNDSKFEISFVNQDKRIVNLKSIVIEIVNVTPIVISPGKYQITLVNSLRAITYVDGFIAVENNINPFNLTQADEFTSLDAMFSLILQYDKVYINWQSSEIQRLRVSITFHHCQQGSYLTHGNCWPNCLHFNQGNYCVERCMKGFYSISGENECQRCPTGCQLCDNSGNCLICERGYYQIDEYCVSTCPTGYFGKDQYCKKCSIHCKSCVAEGVCLECHNSDQQNDNCLIDHNMEISCTPSCTKCDYFCQKCIEKANNRRSCLSCSPPYIEFYGECI